MFSRSSARSPIRSPILSPFSMSSDRGVRIPFSPMSERSDTPSSASFFSRRFESVATKVQGLYFEALGTDDTTIDLDGTIKDLKRNGYKAPLAPYEKKMKIVVTGAAGFLGSHLVDLLMAKGHHVIAIDNLTTGKDGNIMKWIDNENFDLYPHDVCTDWKTRIKECDQIFHLAGSTSRYLCNDDPITILHTCFNGTMKMLELAKECNARFLLGSSCDVYGSPEWRDHPQGEDFLGNVKTFGQRACVEEGKRIAETLCYAFAKQHKVEVRVARIFNTFGPRMRDDDGRVVSTFITQSLRGKTFTIFGDGNSSRSLMFVKDCIDGIVKLMMSDVAVPVNLGNQEEFNMIEVTEMVTKAVRKIRGKKFPVSLTVRLPALKDDPKMLSPSCTLARESLGWEVQTSMSEGMHETVEWFDIFERETERGFENKEIRKEEARQEMKNFEELDKTKEYYEEESVPNSPGGVLLLPLTYCP